MKNNSDEVIIQQKNPNNLANSNFNQNESYIDQSKKNNIITEPLDIKNSLTKSVFDRTSSKFSKKIKIISITIYFIFIISIEFLYRDYLFQKSLILQESIHINPKNILILKISKIISILGAEISAGFFLLLIFLFMPLNYSILFLQCIIYSAYFTNTMKMIYQSDRPNWINQYLNFSCNYGYGNPSGHAFTSSCMYLCLAHIFTKYFKIKGLIRILIFLLCISISFFVSLSRVILGAHSINQIIYGGCLGIGIYFILIHIIGYHNYTSIEFYQHIKKKRIKKIYYIFHIFLLILCVFIYLFSKNKDNSDIDRDVFNNIRCKLMPEYRRYKNDGLFQALSIISIIGAQFGIDILFILLKNNNYMINYSIIEWNLYKRMKFTFLRLFVILFSSFGIILYVVVPGNFNLIFVYITKSALAFFLGTSGIFGIGIFLCIKFKIANKNIYKMDVLHEITAEA